MDNGLLGAHGVLLIVALGKQLFQLVYDSCVSSADAFYKGMPCKAVKKSAMRISSQKETGELATLVFFGGLYVLNQSEFTIIINFPNISNLRLWWWHDFVIAVSPVPHKLTIISL